MIICCASIALTLEHQIFQLKFALGLQSQPCIARTDCPEDRKMVYYCSMD